jgi:hypothetical protein
MTSSPCGGRTVCGDGLSQDGRKDTSDISWGVYCSRMGLTDALDRFRTEDEELRLVGLFLVVAPSTRLLAVVEGVDLGCQ